MNPEAARAVATRRVINERTRHLVQEGWTPEWDDNYTDGQLAAAASAYALAVADELHPASQGGGHYREVAPTRWPFGQKWWKFDPNDKLRALEKAGALILAQMEAILRAQDNG